MKLPPPPCAVLLGKAEVKRVRREKDQKKEEVDARKDRKVAIHCVFPMICGSGGSKSRLAKAAGAEPGKMPFLTRRAKNMA